MSFLSIQLKLQIMNKKKKKKKEGSCSSPFELGGLLFAFFKFLLEFDWENCSIDITLPGEYHRKSELFCENVCVVIDPMNPFNNVSKHIVEDTWNVIKYHVYNAHKICLTRYQQRLLKSSDSSNSEKEDIWSDLYFARQTNTNGENQRHNKKDTVQPDIKKHTPQPHANKNIPQPHSPKLLSPSHEKKTAPQPQIKKNAPKVQRKKGPPQPQIKKGAVPPPQTKKDVSQSYNIVSKKPKKRKRPLFSEEENIETISDDVWDFLFSPPCKRSKVLQSSPT